MRTVRTQSFFTLNIMDGLGPTPPPVPANVLKRRPRVPKNEVVKYLTKSLLRAGYFDKVEETLNKSISEQPKLIREEVARLKKSLVEVDKEISSVFRLQSQLDMALPG